MKCEFVHVILKECVLTHADKMDRVPRVGAVCSIYHNLAGLHGLQLFVFASTGVNQAAIAWWK